MQLPDTGVGGGMPGNRANSVIDAMRLKLATDSTDQEIRPPNTIKGTARCDPSGVTTIKILLKYLAVFIDGRLTMTLALTSLTF